MNSFTSHRCSRTILSLHTKIRYACNLELFLFLSIMTSSFSCYLKNVLFVLAFDIFFSPTIFPGQYFLKVPDRLIYVNRLSS